MKHKVKNKINHLDKEKINNEIKCIETEIEKCLMANAKTPGLFEKYKECYWQSDYSESTINEIVYEIKKAGYNVSLEKEPKIRKQLQLGGTYKIQDDVFYTLTVRFDEE